MPARNHVPAPEGAKPSVALAAGVTVLLWASAFVGIRYAGRGFAPGPWRSGG